MKNYFLKAEIALWGASTALIALSFYLFDRESYLTLCASLIGVYLTFRRSPFYALAYAANDVVLIVLWIPASVHDIRYVSVVTCFAAFLANDLYGFLNRQKKSDRNKTFFRIFELFHAKSSAYSAKLFIILRAIEIQIVGILKRV